MTKLDDLPPIITGPGDYLTRDGRTVTIGDLDGHGTFSAHGAVHREFRGKVRPKDNSIWHPSGRCRAVGEHRTDIVGPLHGEDGQTDEEEPEILPGPSM